MNKETLKEVAQKKYPINNNLSVIDRIGLNYTAHHGFIKGAKWQQEQEGLWFNEYQKVEDYIIKKVGDKFLESTPEKYTTASETTIALLKDNWQQEKSYSEEDMILLLKNIINEIEIRKQNIISNSKKMTVHLLEGGCIAFESSQDVVKECFEQFKKK